MNLKIPTALSPHAESFPPVAVDYERLSQFRRRLRRFLRVSEDLCASHGITSLQYQLLLHLKGEAGRAWATVGELAERLQGKPHGVVALIDRCEQAGLVKRQPSLEDRRQVEIHLLSKGEKLLEIVAGLHQPELRQLRDVLDYLGME